MTNSLHYRMAGLGALSASGAQTALSLSTTGAEAAAPILLTQTSLGPTVAGILGLSSVSLAIPIVGAAIAGISIAIEAILNSGCGQTCVETSQWANQAEGYLEKNISQYFAIQPPRPQSVQQIAMANFQAIWNQLVQLCSQPGLGTAGQRCISDRQDGACKWKATAPQYPGGPALGACWNWWNGYYYPIANDPNVAVATSALASSSGNILSTVVSGGISPLLIVGAAAALMFYMVNS